MNIQRTQPAYDLTSCGIKIVVRPVRNAEPDLLAGRDLAPLVVKGPTGNVLATYAPTTAWTHESVKQRLCDDKVVALVAGDIANAYLGDQWIGGTEV
ncbi:hypothetical protein [Paraburkholderia youngii]|uniref:hypothetical protein n=1 Tax=Paraburkholderia youngii TaxID=2782701 RepID=UPI003D23961D